MELTQKLYLKKLGRQRLAFEHLQAYVPKANLLRYLIIFDKSPFTCHKQPIIVTSVRVIPLRLFRAKLRTSAS